MKKKLLSLALSLAVIAAPASLSTVTGTVPNTVTANAASYADESLETYAHQVAALVNSERAKNGLAPLKFSDELCSAANIRADEIQTVFSHTRPNGTSCFTALSESGINYRYAAENIAYGQRDPQDVMNAWMNSSGHRANILSGSAEYIGVGVSRRNGVYYWTQFFAAANGLSGEVINIAEPLQTTAATTSKTPETTATTTITTTTAAVTSPQTTVQTTVPATVPQTETTVTTITVPEEIILPTVPEEIITDFSNIISGKVCQGNIADIIKFIQQIICNKK